MNILVLLIPVSLILGLAALTAFIWALRAGQYDDPTGSSMRIFLDDEDRPLPPTEVNAPPASATRR